MPWSLHATNTSPPTTATSEFETATAVAQATGTAIAVAQVTETAIALQTAGLAAQQTAAIQQTETVSAMSSNTPTFTATSGPRYRLKSETMYSDGLLNLSVVFSYGPESVAPTGLVMDSYNPFDDTLMTHSEITLDINGNTISATIKDGNNNITGYFTSQTSNGLVIRQNSYDGTGTLQSYKLYQYNASGQVTRIDQYDASDVLQSSVVNQYDSNGRLIRTDNYDGTTLMTSVVTTYNVSGIITRQDTYNGTTLQQYYINTLDGSGRIVTQTFYDGSGVQMCVYTYSYNTPGQNTSIHIDYNYLGITITGDVINTYDANGNIVEMNQSIIIFGQTQTTKIVFTWESY